jgi:hypothetical protein
VVNCSPTSCELQECRPAFFFGLPWPPHPIKGSGHVNKLVAVLVPMSKHRKKVANLPSPLLSAAEQQHAHHELDLWCAVVLGGHEAIGGLYFEGHGHVANFLAKLHTGKTEATYEVITLADMMDRAERAVRMGLISSLERSQTRMSWDDWVGRVRNRSLGSTMTGVLDFLTESCWSRYYHEGMSPAEAVRAYHLEISPPNKLPVGKIRRKER